MTQAIAFNTADMFICASMFLKEMYEKRTTRTVMYLPYAIDVNRFTYLAGGRDTVLARYNQKKLVVYFGSFQPHFDVDKVVTLAKKIVTKEPGVTVLLIGDGPDRARLEAEVRNEGHQNILFLGFVSESDVPSYLSAASVLVFPIRDTITNRSRCPNKIFQFMAARRPVVTNRVGEVASAFKSYAHYFDFDSEEDFERKVREALSRPKVCPPEMVVQNDWSARVATYMQGVKQHLGDH
jgi:glycosyltransferase involved in cell wall biosynthesis